MSEWFVIVAMGIGIHSADVASTATGEAWYVLERATSKVDCYRRVKKLKKGFPEYLGEFDCASFDREGTPL